MRLRSLLAAAALLSASLIARADSYTNFTLTSSYQGNLGLGTIDGTLTLDITTDMFTSADLTAAGFSNPNNNGSITVINSQGPLDGIDDVVELSGTASTDNFTLTIPTIDPAAYSGPICSVTTACSETTYLNGGLAIAASGTLEPQVATTPEPSSFLLLATGLLGATGLAHRRLA